MTYKVIKRFEDAITHKIHEIGTEYPSDAPTERHQTLLNHPDGAFIAKVEDEIKEEIPTAESTAAEIKLYLSKVGVAFEARAKKADLLALLGEKK